MKFRYLITALVLYVVTMGVCYGQKDTANPLLCDTATGVCAMPADKDSLKTNTFTQTAKTIKLIYFTDPICSSCWGIEPQLRKLKLEYGSSIEIDYRMGGLLPDWTYNSGGISKPSDVAHHWDDVSKYYDMPIDGDVWLEDPLHSSYPPSVAFKAAQMQDKEKALLFLRIIREMVFLDKKNITKWEYLSAAATKAGLDIKKFKADYETKAQPLFDADLKLSKEYGVRGFPTIIFVNNNGDKETIYGSKPYAFYETAVLKLHPAAEKKEYSKDWKTLFTKYNTLTAKEYTELSGTPRKESEALLNELTTKGSLEKQSTKNGYLWKLKN